MNHDRYFDLQQGDTEGLTADEMRAGWHFCPEWDYMLTKFNGEECDSCTPWTEAEITEATEK